MFARIVWGKIQPGRWDDYEAAYKKSVESRGRVDGLVVQWLARDQNDKDAGYSVSVWESEAAMNAYVGSPTHKAMTEPLKPYFVNQYTATHCDIRHFARNALPPGDADIYHTN
ncbi:MAG: hypothetical protein RLZ98_13 [Pseudomonadota bacterium]|jgi:heme-degrading monooxygenase HmoA